VFGPGRQMGYTFLIIALPLIIYHQLFFILPLPGETASDQIVNADSEGEGVALAGIEVVSQGLDGHVEWAANGVVLLEYFVVLKAIGKAEVAELELPILEQNVSRLDIPVHDAVLREISAGDAEFVGCLGPVEVSMGVDE